MKRLRDVSKADVPPASLRQEIFALGGRHRGEALAGALRELEDESLSRERRRLLTAVVKHMRTGSSEEQGEGDRVSAGRRPVAMVDLAYLVVIVAAAVWVLVILGAQNG